jgi:probable rRNA maturation factor
MYARRADQVPRRDTLRSQWPEISVSRGGAQAGVPSVRSLQRWAAAVLGQRAGRSAVSLMIVGPARSRALNREYRGKDQATNVLSFSMTGALDAATGRRLLGDLVICPAVLRREAREQGKPVRAHWLHLFVHGLLHLEGLDHERAAEARRMERREIRILRHFGVGNPYRSIHPNRSIH